MMLFIWVVTAILSVWLIVLTFFFFQLISHYNKIIKGSTDGSLRSMIEVLLKDVDIAKKDIDLLRSRCDTIEKEGRLHIQKIGLRRFNPFKDTGGDQSFILAFVDGNNTGIVMSGLYSRSGTRWYAKRVQNGQGIEHELSGEEKSALQEATNISAKK